MAAAPNTALRALQTRIRGFLARIEDLLDLERDQLPLWLPIALGSGIAAWYVLPGREHWLWFIGATVAVAAFGLVIGWQRRLGRAFGWAGALLALGCALIWIRADFVASPALNRMTMMVVMGTVERVEPRPALDDYRLTLLVKDNPAIPPKIRVTMDTLPEGVGEGAVISARVRLMPPPTASVPGGYDFARAAWFQGLGGTGKTMGDVNVISPVKVDTESLRSRLSRHVRSQIVGSEGGIASAFASGDRGGISREDEDAMRASGLTHLLSISGLHVTAVVAAVMFLILRLLALSTRMALRWPLMAIAAAAGAGAGIGYTLLTGSEVPTIRSCIAAVLVLIGIALGREAMTLRLVATGALVVMLVWPESLVGASFQLSFTAIASIVALHEQPRVKAFLARRDEGWVRHFGRGLLGLLLTGLTVEIMLAPIALFHFHKQGLYGALANLVAIPLTTFVIMPLEALALTFDLVGAGAPLWWMTGKAMGLLLSLAHAVAAAPGAVATLPSVPQGAFALMAAGGLWMMLWKSRMRWLGLMPVITGVIWTAATPPPDLIITNDGRHLVVRLDDGQLALLRDRAGDYVRDMLAERAGESEPLNALADSGQAKCSLDICVTQVTRAGRTWVIAATRTRETLEWQDLTALCARVDIIVSDRMLPKGCTPKEIKADIVMLRKTGGLAITLGKTATLEMVNRPGDEHPWVIAGKTPSRPDWVHFPKQPQYRRNSPANLP